MNGFGQVLASQRSDSMKPDMVTYFTIFFNCQLPTPASKAEEGRLRVDGMPGFSVTVLPAPPPAMASAKEDIVCSRGLFGDVEAATVVKWAYHYTQVLNFSRAIVYQIGMDRGITQDPTVAEYVAQGVLIFVDLRDELQRVYGALSPDVLMYSLCIGQIMLKQDCIVRSRSMGARWTLHVDLDEILFMGVDFAPPPGAASTTTFAHLLSNLTSSSSSPALPSSSPLTWISFASHSVVGPVGQHPCACGYLDWAQFLESEMHVHRTVEWSSREPFDCTSRHHTPAMCTGAHGMRKLAVRVDGETAINPIGVSIHVVFECGYSPGCGEAVKQVGVDLSGRIAYLRHYRCLNFALPQPCGRLKGAFWQSPEQIALAIAHTDPPRKVVHRSAAVGG
jgi:hypothetical protein